MQHIDEYDDWYPTEEEMAKMLPIAEVDPDLLAAHLNGTLKKRGRPEVAVKKQVVSLRLDPEVIAAYRATGQGWQRRINDILREHLPR